MLSGAVWPYRLITAILTELVKSNGGRFSIEANTPAESVAFDSDTEKYIIHTPRGPIHAKQVIHATNAHAGHLLPAVRGFVYPIRCNVTVQEKAPEAENRGATNTVMITSPGALNSVYQSPQNGDFYVSGSVGVSNFFEEITTREDTVDSSLVDSMSTVINRAFGRPVQGQVKRNWAGIMGYTADGMPLIGRLDEGLSGRNGKGEWIAAGFNGVGMVNAWLCGEHIADAVLGKQEPRKIPSIYVPSEERVRKAPLESILQRSYAAWE